MAQLMEREGQGHIAYSLGVIPELPDSLTFLLPVVKGDG